MADEEDDISEMEFNYETILAMAKAKMHGRRSYKDFIAQSNKTDPFYITDTRRENAEWFAEMWEKLGKSGVHLRLVHYWLVSQNPPVKTRETTASRRKDEQETEESTGFYLNTEECWKLLVGASRDARYLGLVPLDGFVDQRNPEVRIWGEAWTEHYDPSIITYGDFSLSSFEPEVPDLEDMPAVPHLYCSASVPPQRYLIELWCEKTTMNDVLVPLAERYHANLVTAMGEISLTHCRDCIERAKQDGRSVRVLYISDFDPTGQGMPVGVARKFEFLIRKGKLDLDIQVRSIVLTKQQCIKYKLPRQPLKDTDTRKEDFEEQHGIGGTELDALEALHPGVLAKIVKKEMDRYRDKSIAEKTYRKRAEIQETLDEINDEIHGKHADEITSLTEEHEKIQERLQEAMQAVIDRTTASLDDWRDRAEKVWEEIEGELQDKAPDISDEEWPETEEGDEDDDPLYDSDREYLDQIDRYKEHQGK